jgi:cysteinyl-tRNA synthetase
MTLRVYNTLTQTKEEFVPLEPGKIKMYVCGPTVYDYIHIGNARPLIFFDAVRKYLISSGYEVKYVVNFTDVDDKLIRKAEQTDKTVPEIADFFIQSYFEDAVALGISEATVHPRVTDNIPEIIDFIRELVDHGFAYENGGDVFYRTGRFPEYGKLSHQNLDELQFGIRVEVDDRKESPQDFVLWKQAKPGEISWPSPWGAGRPGWHIECSAMVHKYLGEAIDIHGGGQDLQFPHHECEVAQTEALTGQPLARYWMHNGYIHINEQKMSKSLGNGLNVKQLLETVRPQVFRLFILATHYRNPLNFSNDTMKQAEGGWERINHCVENLRHRLSSAAPGEAERELQEAIRAIEEKFKDKMNDDFNTPDAVTALFDLVSEANHYMQRQEVTEASLRLLMEAFDRMDQVLGVLDNSSSGDLMDEEIEQLIQERTDARKAKNWARADEIRDLLTERGILLEDTAQGIRWRRK